MDVLSVPQEKIQKAYLFNNNDNNRVTWNSAPYDPDGTPGALHRNKLKKKTHHKSTLKISRIH